MGITSYISSQLGDPRGIFGRIVCRMLNIYNHRMYNTVAELIDCGSDSRILEIGYGNGQLTKMLYRKTGSHIYGIDISDDMRIAASERNAEGVRRGRIHLKTGDCCDLTYKNDSFDFVVTMNTVYFWSDALRGLEEIRRTLKDGGIFYNAVYSKKGLEKLPYTKTNFHLYETGELIRLGRAAGFKSVSVKTIGMINIVRYIK